MNIRNVYDGNMQKEYRIYYYNSLKNQIYSVINNLKESIKSLQKVSTEINACYKIDDSKVETIKIDNIIDKINEKINYLNNKIIPNINYQIRAISNEPTE